MPQTSPPLDTSAVSSIPEISNESTNPNEELTIEPLTATSLPVPTDTPMVVPNQQDNLASPEILETQASMLIITRTVLTASDFPETNTVLAGDETIRYEFSEFIRLGNVLANGDLLTYSDNQTVFSLVDLADSTRTPFLGDVWPHHELIQQDQSEILIVAVKALPDQPYPIWAVPLDGKPLFLLGTTAGNSPRFSVTEDGQVLLLENGHLVLKRIEEGVVESQSLDAVEKVLALNWDAIDWTKPPYHDNVPYIDFTISPDGQQLAIFDGVRGKLWVVSTDGQVLEEIPYGGYSPEIPGEGPMIVFQDWSPDSHWLGYRHSYWMDVTDLSRVYNLLQVVAIDNDTTPITLSSPGVQEHGIDLAWSPNGKYLAFSVTTSNFHPSGQPIQSLFVANGDGSAIREISNIFLGDSINGIFWQQDSSHLIYRCLDPIASTNAWRPDVCRGEIIE